MCPVSGKCRSGLSKTNRQMIEPSLSCHTNILTHTLTQKQTHTCSHTNTLLLTHTHLNSRRGVGSCSERVRLLSEVIVISISHSNSWLQWLEAQSCSSSQHQSACSTHMIQLNIQIHQNVYYHFMCSWRYDNISQNQSIFRNKFM